MRPFAIAALALSVGALTAAETQIADLRFGFGGGPLPSSQTGTLAGGSFRQGFSGGPGYVANLGVGYGTLSPFGLVWGGEWNYVSARMDQVGGSQVVYRQSSLLLDGGIGLATSQSSHLELVALAGISHITLESDIAGASTTGAGNGPMFGGRLAWYWTMDSSWQIGLQAEWTKAEADLSTNTPLGSYESTISNAGVSGRATLGYRF